ncbi:hypothetical protein ACHQM5_020351 [Ranunculus cassubicifolius]
MMVLKIIAVCLVLFSVGIAEAQKVEPKTIHVGGKVLCQDCAEGWNEWVAGTQPIKGGKVSITCMDERSRVIFYGSDVTDDKGVFDLVVPKSVNGKKLKHDLCSVRLVSAPDTVCNIPTNFGGGQLGVKLNRPSLVYRDLIKYVVGPFYFTTPMCDQPEVMSKK